MKATSHIVGLLLELQDSLVRSKNPSFSYMGLLIKGFDIDAGGESLKDLLVRIKSGAKIIDCANFNPQQEEIWGRVWEEATRLLAGHF